MIKRPYQCGLAVYQLAKLRILEFYYDFLDKHFSGHDSELHYMDTDSFNSAIIGNSLDEFVKPKIRRLIRKIGLQQTKLARELRAYLSLNL